MGVRRLFALLGYQWQILFNKQLLACVVLLLLLPSMVSFQAIDLFQAARVTECYFSLVGLILIGTISLPESGADFAELLRSRPINSAQILSLRFGGDLVLLVLLTTGWAVFLHQFNLALSITVYIVAGLAAAFFWGAISAVLGILTQNAAIGFLAVVLAYLYIVFGMSRRLAYYPLTLLVEPNKIKFSTLSVLGISCGALLLALFWACLRDNGKFN
ncbi:hypothetical protein [Loigolactobacillus binensis]|uniref:ABC transporter permease n=1 Tax=Loigolactobacillus binensis TaxID=2559922 RepID=A0ABW3EDD7_9LACO|nr:hypothetical protein [Loigolactobacillus binensis]